MDSRIERRKTIRYKAPEGATVVTPHSLCQLTDVSLSGMSMDGHRNVDISEEFYIDILVAGNCIYYDNNVPVKLVWEKQFPHPYLPLFTLKKIGLEFGNLSATQLGRLDSYLMNQEKLLG